MHKYKIGEVVYFQQYSNDKPSKVKITGVNSYVNNEKVIKYSYFFNYKESSYPEQRFHLSLLDLENNLIREVRDLIKKTIEIENKGKKNETNN